MQAWDGWTPPVTTSVASKALSIKDHAFAPAAGTAEVAGWTPVTNTHMHTYVHMKGTSSVTVQRLRIPAWNELSAHGFSESESIDLSNDQVFSAIDLYMDQMFSQVITSSYPLPISSSEAGAPHESYSEKEMTGPLLTRDASAPAERQFPSARYEALVARVKVDSDLPGNYTLRCDPAETLWGQDFFN